MEGRRFFLRARRGRVVARVDIAKRTGCTRQGKGRVHRTPRQVDADAGGPAYHTVMIDQGFCFNAGEWSFPDAPLRGLYARSRVYEGVTGMHSFAPWLERLQKRITEKVLAELAAEVPPAWYDDEYDDVMRVLEQLHRRKPRVEELLLSAKNCNRQPFASWR